MTAAIDIRAFVQGSPHPSWLVHSDGHCIYANLALEQLTGARVEPPGGTYWLDLLVDDDKPQAIHAWQESLSTGLPLRIYVRLRGARPASYTHVELIAFGHSDGPEEIWLFTALQFHPSIHQHSPLEAQLRTTLNLIPIQTWYATPAGAVVFVNEATASYLGLPQLHSLRYGEEVGGDWESHLIFIHPEDHPHARRQWAACLRQHSAGDLQVRLLEGDGGNRWFSVRAEPLKTKGGDLLYWVGINIDIDDAKRAGAALDLAKERIARASQLATIAELSAFISHEIVQPISAVVANASAALNWMSRETPDLARAKMAIEGILRDGMAVGNVVHETRALFKHQSPSRSTIQLNDLVKQVLKLLEPTLRARNIQVSADLHPGLPTTEADAIQIQQVLINLIHNASEALVPQYPHPQTITVRTLLSDDSVIVEVDDSGRGIEAPERIFDAFFTNKDERLGVGLSVSRSIAEAHGGSLIAINLKNCGARFRLSLPRNSLLIDVI
ncbi:PAS domain-containing sensor histidine kinase [Terriglobus albidus]|nr:ATP-binding protein [Terriglobus albidus]